MARADRAEMSWDGEKHGWVVRVIVGEEVIKRRCPDVKQAAAEEALRAAALKVAADEGFDLAPEAIAIRK
jgi:ribosomal protein L16/L10AE